MTIAAATVLFFGVTIFAIEFSSTMKIEEERLTADLSTLAADIHKHVQRLHEPAHLIASNSDALQAARQNLKLTRNPEIFFGRGAIYYEIMQSTRVDSGGTGDAGFRSPADGPRRDELRLMRVERPRSTVGLLSDIHAVESSGAVTSIRVLWDIAATFPWKDWVNSRMFAGLVLTGADGSVLWREGLFPPVASAGPARSGSVIPDVQWEGRIWIVRAEELTAFTDPVTLSVSLPKSYIYAKSWQRSRGVLMRTLVIVAIGFCFVLVLAAWVRHTLRPLDEISQGVRRIAEGDLQTVLNPGGDDEIGFLAETVNEMTHRLKVKEQSVQAHIQLLKEKNDELRAVTEKLKELDKLKDNFIAVLSHELRTPLTAVLGYSELFLEGIYGPMNEQQKENIEFLRTNAIKLQELIEDMLDIAKIRAGTLRMEPERFAASEVTEDIGRFMLTVLRDRPEVKYVLELAENLSHLEHDRTRLEQVLTNLLSNAVKFTERGYIKLLVRAPDAATIAFSVEDSGVGIPPTDIKKVFAEFVQLDAGVRRRYGGVGLGLTICKSLVEKMGGKIGVESEVGRGSRFTVTLPLCYRPPSAPIGPSAAALDEPGRIIG